MLTAAGARIEQRIPDAARRPRSRGLPVLRAARRHARPAVGAAGAGLPRGGARAPCPTRPDRFPPVITRRSGAVGAAGAGRPPRARPRAAAGDLGAGRVRPADAARAQRGPRGAPRAGRRAAPARAGGRPAEGRSPMTVGRRTGAPRLIEWTGERCVPWAPDVQVVYEHMHRYLWATALVEGRACSISPAARASAPRSCPGGRNRCTGSRSISAPSTTARSTTARNRSASRSGTRATCRLRRRLVRRGRRVRDDRARRRSGPGAERDRTACSSPAAS